MIDPANNDVLTGPTPRNKSLSQSASAFFSHGAVIAVISGIFALGVAYIGFQATVSSQLPELRDTIGKLTNERDLLTRKITDLELRSSPPAKLGQPEEDYIAAKDALAAAEKRISILEDQLQRAQIEIRRATEARNEADSAVADLQFSQQTPGAVVEHLSVPPLNFIPIMQNEYLLQVISIRDGVAEAKLKNTRGPDDDLFLKKGSQIVRSYREMNCRMTVTDVAENLLSVMTSCVGRPD